MCMCACEESPQLMDLCLSLQFAHVHCAEKILNSIYHDFRIFHFKVSIIPLHSYS